jgi:hypothetical protein
MRGFEKASIMFISSAGCMPEGFYPQTVKSARTGRDFPMMADYNMEPPRSPRDVVLSDESISPLLVPERTAFHGAWEK